MLLTLRPPNLHTETANVQSVGTGRSGVVKLRTAVGGVRACILDFTLRLCSCRCLSYVMCMQQHAPLHVSNSRTVQWYMVCGSRRVCGAQAFGYMDTSTHACTHFQPPLLSLANSSVYTVAQRSLAAMDHAWGTRIVGEHAELCV